MKIDDVNIGCNTDQIFDITDTISFNTTDDGSVWMTMDFNDTIFDTSSDMIIDLIHVFDGDASGTEYVRLQIEVWVAGIGNSPSSSSPTINQTTDLTVTTSNDNTFQETTSFLTISSDDLNSNIKTITFKVTRDQDHSNDTYTGDYHLVSLAARQSFTLPSSFTHTIRPADMKLDDTNTGSDNSEIFDITDTISFDTVTDGTVRMSIDFSNTVFDITSDITVGLIHVFDGDASGTEYVRLQIEAWVSDIGESPSSGSPTVNQTTDLTVTTSNDNTFQETTNFLTIPSSNLNSNTKVITFQITRDQDHSNDTYDGTYHLVSLLVKQ